MHKLMTRSAEYFILGTKSDLRENSETNANSAKSGDKVVTKKEAESFVRVNKMYKYIECSALTDINIQEVCISY